MNPLKRILLAATLLMIIVPGKHAFAQESEKWEYTIVPYAWFANTNGNVTIGQETARVDVGVDQTFDNTRFAATFQLEARKGRGGLFLQPNYLNINDNQDIGRSNVNVDTTLKTWMVEFGGFYRALELGRGTEHPTNVDLLVGGRYWGIQRDTNLSFPVTDFSINNIDKGTHITEPFVGIRFLSYFTPQLAFGARGDIGGFGINNSGVKSKFTWQTLAFLQYDFNKVVGVEAGYRWLTINMEDKDLPFSNKIDLTFEGVIAGVSFRF